MTLTVGVSIGPYEILAPLGAGGMGEVYRARDAKLNREIALKVLPEGLIDADRLARFKREAHVLAALNHPNIAAIYGFEETDGVHALVLELVEGPTLADRLQRGRIPVDEALPIARQVADALEAAHEVGIVHRDLKPANIKLRTDGTVKVLDFGLAKTLESPADTLGHVTVSPTITSPAMTQQGMILGTAAYMSPEQAKGRRADKRSDVWAFGVVLFEMLSGRRPFRGDDVTDTLAAVLRADPAWTELPPETPPAVHRLLRRCLQKDPKHRMQHVGDVRLELAEIQQGTSERPSIVAASPRMPRAAVSIASAAAFAIIGVALGRWLPDRVEPTVVKPIFFTITPSAGEQFAGGPPLAISNDGSRIAFAVVREPGRQQLFLRSLDRPEAVALAGTEAGLGQGMHPFFSPDGTSIAFFADGHLKRVSVTGGPSDDYLPCPSSQGWRLGPGRSNHLLS